LLRLPPRPGKTRLAKRACRAGALAGRYCLSKSPASREVTIMSERLSDRAIGDPTDQEVLAAGSMLRLMGGLHISRAIYAAAELGIADLLAGGPKTAAELAEITGTHEPSLYRVLRLLARVGVLTEDAGFGLTLLGERLRTGVPASLRWWAGVADAAGFEAWEKIVETLRTGRPGAEIAFGVRGMEYVSRDPARVARFQAAMSERTAGYAPSVAAGYDFSGVRVIADIGGGQGTLLATILAAHGHLRGVLLDRPEVVAAAPAVLREAGVADRCEIVTGDFFEAVPAGADCYLMANVLHDWEDPLAVTILAHCRRVMPAGGRVLIAERLIADDPELALPVLLSDMNMLVVTGGRERTNAEYADLLAQAGLRLAAITPVAWPYGVIEGTLPG
jgi:orsellinic acid C2-O-methyltransferase